MRTSVFDASILFVFTGLSVMALFFLRVLPGTFDAVICEVQQTYAPVDGGRYLVPVSSCDFVPNGLFLLEVLGVIFFFGGFCGVIRGLDDMTRGLEMVER